MSPARCAAVLREIDADIVALQEIEFRPDESRDPLAILADDAGYRAIAGATMLRADAHYGNAILTRLEAERVRRHDLSVPGREPRGALDIELSLKRLSLRLVATHLGLRPGERRAQIRRLLSVLQKNQCDLQILAGDLNEWFLWGRPLRMLHREFPDTPHRRTWPSHVPVFALDRIWASPPSTLQSLTAHRSVLSRVASDHLPLVADISLSTTSRT
jgi:endonuclease/exonuclease/phosphatase family metal-dependent hydrolase